jgi:hypothetical protein
VGTQDNFFSARQSPAPIAPHSKKAEMVAISQISAMIEG